MRERVMGVLVKLDDLLTDQFGKVDAATAASLLPAAVDMAAAVDTRLLVAAQMVAILQSHIPFSTTPRWSASRALLEKLRGIAAQRGEL